MGRPTKYSVELPARCQALIDRYGQQIVVDADPNDGFEGPLLTTFLLAMATPMLVLPLERIFRPAVWGDPGVADDLALDERLGDRVKQVDVPLSFHPAATRVLGLVTPRSVG